MESLSPSKTVSVLRAWEGWHSLDLSQGCQSLGGENNINSFSHSFRCKKSNIKMLVGLCSPQMLERWIPPVSGGLMNSLACDVILILPCFCVLIWCCVCNAHICVCTCACLYVSVGVYMPVCVFVGVLLCVHMCGHACACISL